MDVLEIVLDEGTGLNNEFFERALRTCRKIQTLEIKGAWLKQQQFDQMPNYFQNLKILVFEHHFALGNLNFDFATKLKNLYKLELNFNIKQERMSFLLKNCHYQPDFHLHLRGKPFGSTGSEIRMADSKSSVAIARLIAL